MARRAVKPITIILVVIGVIFFVIGFVYLTTKVRDLPQFLGGKTPGKKHPHRYGGTYKKRAIASFILGILAFVGAYYTARARKVMRLK
jgi:hypothetical protein